MKKFDVIIVGSGISALSSALTLKNKNILIISKDVLWECNSFYAQGGVTVAKNKEDVKQHIQDTLKAGVYINNKQMVEILSKDSLSLIDDLRNLGFEFDKENGKIHFTKEAVHSTNRIVHAGGDATGMFLHKFMISNNNAYILANALVFDLLIEDDICYGVSVYKDNKKFNIYADNVILASGGIGALYKYDTNSRSISGDIQGIAIQKGITLKNMEMTQFHPTVYVNTSFARKMLLSESLRGEGAYVVDENGDRFLFEYDQNGELAPRDVVSRAIYMHQQKGHKIFLDFSQFTKEHFLKRFPTIYKKFTNLGFNIPKDKIPISPAFHYIMGGIEVDENSKVKNYKNLFAVGEVAYTGVHGANRLASNSLLECYVFGKRCAKFINKFDFKTESKKFDFINEELFLENDKYYKNKLREIMWNNVGIIRNEKGLKKALDFVEENINKVGYLAKLRFLTAKNIIISAINNKNSIGAHYRID